MQISQVMTAYTQPDFLQIWWKEISQPVCIRNVWFFDSTKCTPQYELNSSVTIATYWVPDLPHTKSFSCHLWHSILIFVDSTSYAWSSKHINMLARVCGLVYRFSSWKSLTYWNQVVGEGKQVSCNGNGIFIAMGVFPVELSACQVSMFCFAKWPR